MVPIEKTSIATDARHRTSEVGYRISGIRYVAWEAAKIMVFQWRLIVIVGEAIGNASCK
jgi:hypothetical protein